MRVFVPMQDEWDSGVSYAGEAPVPYRAGLPLWREPVHVEGASTAADAGGERAAPMVATAARARRRA